MRSAASSESAIIGPQSAISTAVRKRVKRAMWERVGILRDERSLQRAISEFEQIGRANLPISSRNFVTLALLVARAALCREESRGGHFRSDFPEQRDGWRAHSVQKFGEPVASARQIDFSKDSANAAM